MHSWVTTEPRILFDIHIPFGRTPSSTYLTILQLLSDLLGKKAEIKKE